MNRIHSFNLLLTLLSLLIFIHPSVAIGGEIATSDSQAASAIDGTTLVVEASPETKSLYGIFSWRLNRHDAASTIDAGLTAVSEKGHIIWHANLLLSDRIFSMSSLQDGRYAEVSFDFDSASPAHSWMARGVDGKAVRLILPQTLPTTASYKSLADARSRDLTGEHTASTLITERQRVVGFYKSPSYLSARSELAPIFNGALAASELWQPLWIDAWPFLEKTKSSVGVGADMDRPAFLPDSNQEKVMCLTVYEQAYHAASAIIAQGTNAAIGCAAACAGSAGCAYYGAATPGCWASIAGCIACLGIGGYGAVQTCMNMWDSIMK